MPWRLFATVCLALVVVGCGPGETTRDDAGDSADAADAGDARPTETVCNPISPECGGENWQFQSDSTCPEERPQPVTACQTPRATCYYCEDPAAAESEPGHPFTVMACAPEPEQWQVQELTCQTN